MNNINTEVAALQVLMKIKPDFSNVRQRIRNASMATKIKYKKAVLANAIDNLSGTI
jgi:hypothetical protein